MNFLRTRLGLAMWTVMAITFGHMVSGIADIHIVVIKGQPPAMQEQGAEPTNESDSIYLWRKV